MLFLLVIAYVVYFFFFKSFAYKLNNPGPNGLVIVKDIKDSNPYLGLADAKYIVDNTPYVMGSGSMNYFKAKKFVETLNAHGAQAEFIIPFIWKKVKYGSLAPIDAAPKQQQTSAQEPRESKSSKQAY